MLRPDTSLFVWVSFSKFENLYSRSKPILEGAGEYFIEHGMTLNTPQVFSISRLYGELDFHPPNGFKFWDILEHVLVIFCDSNFKTMFSFKPKHNPWTNLLGSYAPLCAVLPIVGTLHSHSSNLSFYPSIP